MWALLIVVALIVFMLFWNPGEETAVQPGDAPVSSPPSAGPPFEVGASVRRKEHRVFNLGWKVRWTAIGMIAFIAAVVVSGTFGFICIQAGVEPILALLLGLVCCLCLTVVLAMTPWFHGNAVLCRAFPATSPGHLVQLTYNPRIIRGLEGVLDDADDFGRFWIDNYGLHFDGDGTSMDVPAASVERCRVLPSLYMPFCGGRLDIHLRNSSLGFVSFRIAARTGNTIVGSRKANRKLREDLVQWRTLHQRGNGAEAVEG